MVNISKFSGKSLFYPGACAPGQHTVPSPLGKQNHMYQFLSSFQHPQTTQTSQLTSSPSSVVCSTFGWWLILVGTKRAQVASFIFSWELILKFSYFQPHQYSYKAFHPTSKCINKAAFFHHICCIIFSTLTHV